MLFPPEIVRPDCDIDTDLITHQTNKSKFTIWVQNKENDNQRDLTPGQDIALENSWVFSWYGNSTGDSSYCHGFAYEWSTYNAQWWYDPDDSKVQSPTLQYTDETGK
jgi:hypothetical protein